MESGLGNFKVYKRVVSFKFSARPMPLSHFPLQAAMVMATAATATATATVFFLTVPVPTATISLTVTAAATHLMLTT